MTRVLARLKRLVEENDQHVLDNFAKNQLLVAMSSINEARKTLRCLKEGRSKALVYTAMDDLELRIAEAIEELL